MTVAALFHRFGPYHVARLAAAARRGAVVGIEVSAVTREYAWDPVAESGFRRVTLFTDDSVADARGVADRVSQALDEAAPAVVLVPGWSSAAAIAATRWCVRRGTPAVVMSESTADDEPRKGWKEAIKRGVLRSFSAALVGGRRHAEYARQLGIPSDRIFTGYDAVDNDHFAAGAEAARREPAVTRERYGLPARYFLASNRFIPKKNLPALLSAYATYRSGSNDPWDLVLLGDGPGRAEVEQTVRQLTLAGSVRLPGFKQYADLPAYYALAGAFVHASTSEQWGLVVNEAMAAGLPVLVSDRCGCAPDLVEHGVTGYTFNPTDPSELAGLFVRLASDEARRAAMGVAARQAVAAYSPEAFADGLWSAAASVRGLSPNPGLPGRLALAVVGLRW